MKVSKNITIDLNNPRRHVVHLMESGNQREIILTLLKDGMPFDVSEGIGTATLVKGVGYIKANGVPGYYDWTSTDMVAVEAVAGSTNKWTVRLDEHATDVPGFAQIFVKFSLASGETLYSFPITLDVIRTSGGTTDPDKPYYHSSSFLLVGAQATKTSAMTAPIGVDANGKLWGEAGGWSDEAKQLLIGILRSGLYSSDQSSNISALESALEGDVTLESITADYEQDRPIYDTDDLDAIKVSDDLTVTANYSDGSTLVLNDDAYTLSGTLTAGTSIITISYGGKATTISVTVTHQIVGWYYPFNQSLLSEGTEEFGFVGQGVYADGLFNRKCYSHIIPTLNDPTSDTQLGLKAVNPAKFPNLGGDYTVSYWCKTQRADRGHPLWMTYYQTGTASMGYYTGFTSHVTGWIVKSGGSSGLNLAGYAHQFYPDTGTMAMLFRITKGDKTKAHVFSVTPPASFDFTQWHHYAMTRKGTTVRVFVDGVLIGSATAEYATVFAANQIAISSYFEQNASNPSDLAPAGFGEYVQDLYIAEFCKWEASFDPTDIEY